MNEEDKQILYPGEELQAIKDADDKFRVKHEKYMDDWRILLSTAASRRIMWELLGDLGLFKNPFNKDNHALTGFMCGQHDFALKLVNDMEEAIPGIILKMQNEFRSSQASDQKGQR